MRIKEKRHHIERAVRMCEDMPEVRTHLVRALRELERKDKKSESSGGETPLERWRFDARSGSLVNMGRVQIKNALGKIESMISDEKKKILDSDPGSMLTD